MGGWKAPTGAHIRNYMLVYDKVTFFWTATNAGATRPTGQAIGEKALKVIEDIGEFNIAAMVTDNAAAETTSWDTIREAQLLCTGCTAHARCFLALQGMLQPHFGEEDS
jgi:hypothetical protein